MPLISVNERRVHYEMHPSQGKGSIREGQTILFLHGGDSCLNIYAHQLKVFARKYTGVAVDLPGFGRSEGPPIYEMGHFREFIRDFVGAMKLPPFVFCGHSVGGSIALEYALHHQEKLRALILVGSGARWGFYTPEALELWRSNPQRAMDEERKILFSSKTAPQTVKRVIRETMPTDPWAELGVTEACNSFDVVDQLDRIKLPVLILCGEEEPWLDESRQIKSRIPHAQMEIIPDAGHMVMAEQADKFNTVISRFLDSL